MNFQNKTSGKRVVTEEIIEDVPDDYKPEIKKPNLTSFAASTSSAKSTVTLNQKKPLVNLVKKKNDLVVLKKPEATVSKPPIESSSEIPRPSAGLGSLVSYGSSGDSDSSS